MSLNDEKLLNVTDAAITQVKSGAGRLHRITLNETCTTPIEIYDSLASSGTKIATIADNTTAQTLEYGGRFALGLRICAGDAVAASATLTSDETQPSVDETVTIGTGDNERVYRFKSTMLAAYDVKIGADADLTLANLVLAINGTGEAGTNYFAGTLAHPDVTAADVAAHATVVTAKVKGVVGNAIAKAEDSAHLDWDGAGAVFTSGAEGSTFDLTVSYS